MCLTFSSNIVTKSDSKKHAILSGVKVKVPLVNSIKMKLREQFSNMFNLRRFKLRRSSSYVQLVPTASNYSSRNDLGFSNINYEHTITASSGSMFSGVNNGIYEQPQQNKSGIASETHANRNLDADVSRPGTDNVYEPRPRVRYSSEPLTLMWKRESDAASELNNNTIILPSSSSIRESPHGQVKCLTRQAFDDFPLSYTTHAFHFR